jgi:hypothetical protein
MDRDERPRRFEVEDVDHELDRRFVDGERDEVPLVCGGEQRRQLAVGELGRRTELHGHGSMMPDQTTWSRGDGGTGHHEEQNGRPERPFR